MSATNSVQASKYARSGVSMPSVTLQIGVAGDSVDDGIVNGACASAVTASAAESSACISARSPPEFFRRQSRAFRQALELRPHHLRMHARNGFPLREAAVGRRDDVFAPEQLREPDDAIGHE